MDFDNILLKFGNKGTFRRSLARDESDIKMSKENSLAIKKARRRTSMSDIKLVLEHTNIFSDNSRNNELNESNQNSNRKIKSLNTRMLEIPAISSSERNSLNEKDIIAPSSSSMSTDADVIISPMNSDLVIARMPFSGDFSSSFILKSNEMDKASKGDTEILFTSTEILALRLMFSLFDR